MNQYFDANRGEKLSLHRQIDKQVAGLIDRKLLEGEARIKTNIAAQKKQMEANLGKLKTKTQKDKYQESGKEAKRIKEGKDDLEIIHRGREQVESWDQTVDRPFFLWHLFFGNVLKDGGFDIVIANPPYVRHELIKQYKEPLKKEGYACYDGVADLFVYFFEKGIQLLKPGGSLCFICSNKYFRAGYGEKLRKYLGEKTIARQIIDFGDADIFDATAYPSIVVLEKRVDGTIKDADAHTVQALKWKSEWGRPEKASIQQVASQKHFLLAQAELRPSGWPLESPEVLRLLEKLHRAGKPLREIVKARVSRGLTTGLNEAFVVDLATRDRLIREHNSSAEILKPYLRGKDIDRWRTEFADQFIVKIESSENKAHPWSGKSKKDAEQIFAKTYPAIYSHFEKLRNGLINRDDQGKYFWEQRSCKYWQEFEKWKIVSTKISIRPTFALDLEKRYLGNTAYFIPANYAGHFLLGLLNSSLFFAYAKKVFVEKQGGWFEIQPDGLETFPIPAVPSEKQKPLEKLVERILSVKQKCADTDVSELEQEIDQLVYKLYDLNPAEIVLVEENTRLGIAASTERVRRPIENFTALPDGVWANPQPDVSVDETLALTAILKSMDGPMPIQHVRLAALLVSNPRLLTPRLSADAANTWRRLIGSEASPLGSNTIQFVALANQAWSNAVRHQRGNGRLIEDLANDTWAPGEDLNAISTVGWPDGRARMVMNILSQYAIEQLIQQLPEQAQRRIYGAAA